MITAKQQKAPADEWQMNALELSSLVSFPASTAADPVPERQAAALLQSACDEMGAPHIAALNAYESGLQIVFEAAHDSTPMELGQLGSILSALSGVHIRAAQLSEDPPAGYASHQFVECSPIRRLHLRGEGGLHRGHRSIFDPFSSEYWAKRMLEEVFGESLRESSPSVDARALTQALHDFSSALMKLKARFPIHQLRLEPSSSGLCILFRNSLASLGQPWFGNFCKELEALEGRFGMSATELVIDGKPDPFVAAAEVIPPEIVWDLHDVKPTGHFVIRYFSDFSPDLEPLKARLAQVFGRSVVFEPFPQIIADALGEAEVLHKHALEDPPAQAGHMQMISKLVRDILRSGCRPRRVTTYGNAVLIEHALPEVPEGIRDYLRSKLCNWPVSILFRGSPGRSPLHTPASLEEMARDSQPEGVYVKLASFNGSGIELCFEVSPGGEGSTADWIDGLRKCCSLPISAVPVRIDDSRAAWLRDIGIVLANTVVQAESSGPSYRDENPVIKSLKRHLHRDLSVVEPAGRDWPIFSGEAISIDYETVQLKEDAISFEELRNGNRVITKHFVDGAAIAPHGGSLDLSARKLWESCYVRDKARQGSPVALSMLPGYISSGGNLGHGEMRLVWSATLEVSPAGSIIRSDLTRNLVSVKHTLSFDDVSSLMSSNNKMSRRLHELCETLELLRIKREAAGAYFLNDLSFPEFLAEESTIWGNWVVADFLYRRALPAPWRVHPPPTEEQRRTLAGAIGEIEKSDCSRYASDPLMFRDFIQSAVQRHGLDRLRPLLKPMLYGHFSCEAGAAHSMLGFPYYVNISGPMRRYAGLLTQQVLAGVFGDIPVPSAQIQRLMDDLNEYRLTRSLRREVLLSPLS